MPKKVKVHPNERIDIPDFERNTEYAAESVAQLNERLFQARYPLIVEGFRVRIEDQASNPGEITIFNGTALDRDGKILHDEDQNSVSKSITLSSASTSFYVEIEFVETESDTDARAFWDPTFDQVDPIPDGKEFSLNVATRKTPSWRIVSPVSTTDFEVNTNPDSNKIPIVKLTTNGDGEIDGASNPELTQVFPSTVSEQAVSSGDSSIRVFDSRLFNAGDTVTVDVGGSSPDTGLAISSIDYDNHIISFSGTFDFAHDEGAIVRRTSGTGRIMEQEVSPGIGFLGTHPDAANYAFQGNEIRGGALVQSKETFGERDDLNIRSLKDQIDALAAVIRELKFGSTQPSVTSAAPPDSFVSEPRWVDNAGGVTGARANSVSIGDGSSTFGDFNGIGGNTFQDAIDSLPSEGGLIFVKSGSYVLASTITIDKPVIIQGVGAATELRNFGADPLFLITTTGHVQFEDVSIPDEADEDSIEIQSDVTLILDNVTEVYRINVTNESEPRIFAKNVEFVDTIVATSTSEVINNSIFIGCSFNENIGASSWSRSIFENCLFNGNIDDVLWSSIVFKRCRFNGTFSSFVQLSSFNTCEFNDLLTLTNNTTQVSFNSCSWGGSGTIDIQGAVEVYFSDCRFASELDPATVENALSITNPSGNISFDSCTFEPIVTGTSSSDLVSMIAVDSSDVSVLRVTNCSLEVTASTFAVGINLFSSSSNDANLYVEGCAFFGFVSGVLTSSYNGNLFVNNTHFTGNSKSLTDDFFGIQVAASIFNLQVSNCRFDGYENVEGNVRGISTDTASEVTVTGCVFEDIGTNGPSFNVRAISVDAAGANANICGNIIKSAAGNVVEAIYTATGASGRTYIAGNIIEGLNGGGTSDDSGIHVDTGSNITVVNNVIEAFVRHGIRSDLSGDNVVIDNNLIRMGSDSTGGIYVLADNLSIENLSVSNNSVSGLEGGNVGIQLALQINAFNVKVHGNKVSEGTYDANNVGILLSDTTSEKSEGVSVSHNSVRAVSLGISDRNTDGNAIRVEECDYVAVDGNIIKWVTSSVDGVSLKIVNCAVGTVNNNVITPDGSSSFEIDFSGSTHMNVVGNIVTDGTTDGTINESEGTNSFGNNKLS